MKIIDLLNKIANDEEVPKKIKYKNKIYERKEYDVCYEKIMTKKGWVKELGYVAKENGTYFYLKHCYQDLNDEIEIIEDKPFNERVEEIYNRHIDYIYGKEDKKIEKLNYNNNDEFDIEGFMFDYEQKMQIVDKINEIINYINEGDK